MGLLYIGGTIGDIRSDDLKSGGRQGTKAGRSLHLVSSVLFFFLLIYDLYHISICDLQAVITRYTVLFGKGVSAYNISNTVQAQSCNRGIVAHPVFRVPLGL